MIKSNKTNLSKIKSNDKIECFLNIKNINNNDNLNIS